MLWQEQGVATGNARKDSLMLRIGAIFGKRCSSASRNTQFTTTVRLIRLRLLIVQMIRSMNCSVNKKTILTNTFAENCSSRQWNVIQGFAARCLPSALCNNTRPEYMIRFTPSTQLFTVDNYICKAIPLKGSVPKASSLTYICKIFLIISFGMWFRDFKLKLHEIEYHRIQCNKGNI